MKDTFVNNVFEHDVDFRSRTIYVTSEIDDYTVASWIKGLRLLEKTNSNPIEVIVNSPGGCIYSGLALYDALRSSPCHITTHGTGLIASMGGVIYLAGSDRTLTPRAKYMVHASQAFLVGDPKDIKIEYEELMSLEKDVLKIFEERTKKDTKFWKKYERNTYFTPAQCVKLGIADTVIEYMEEE